jgi:hypothetical protein
MFQETVHNRFIILVQLRDRDPAVQSAQSIADLIPCPDTELAQEVASAIKANLGRGILWILDGWDELPSYLREKLLNPAIEGSCYLPLNASESIVALLLIMQLCELAFSGIFQNKVYFSSSDLKTVKDPAVVCEVGLLQATPSILSDGRTVYYTFLHLSIKEMLLAALIYRSHACQ